MRAEDEFPADEYVPIRSYTQAWEAQLAGGRLESEGIPVLLVGEHHASVNWLHAVALGGVELRVPQGRAEEAEALLDEEFPVQEANPASIVPPCPACGSGEVSRSKLAPALAAASWLLLGIPLLLVTPRYRCEECGHKWKQR